MNNLITRLVKVSLSVLCLSSCTVIRDPVSLSYVHHSGFRSIGDMDIRVEHPNTPKGAADNLSRIRGALGDDESEVAKPSTAASAPRVEVCGRFIPPVRPELPKLTEKQMEEVSRLPPDKFNEALLTHMKTMYRYGKATQNATAEAVKKHNATCRQAVVQ